MTHHIKGQGRHQVTLLPEALDDFVTENNPVRVIDISVDGLQLDSLGLERVRISAGYHVETVHLWIPEPHPILPQVRERNASQR